MLSFLRYLSRVSFSCFSTADSDGSDGCQSPRTFRSSTQGGCPHPIEAAREPIFIAAKGKEWSYFTIMDPMVSDSRGSYADKAADAFITTVQLDEDRDLRLCSWSCMMRGQTMRLPTSVAETTQKDFPTSQSTCRPMQEICFMDFTGIRLNGSCSRL